MGIKERLAVVEAKLGIESIKDGPIFTWDGDDVLNGRIAESRYDSDDDDRVSVWDHFAYLTPEILAAIKALPEAAK